MATVVKGKIVRSQKQPAEFGADNIDNTAPVKKILEDLQVQNNQAFSFYAHTIRQKRTTKEKTLNYHFAVNGHPLNAFPEDWDGGLHSGYFEAFTYKSLMPKMLTEMCNIEKSDPVTDYMKLKSEWHQDCRFLRLSAKVKGNNKLEKYESLNEEVAECPKHFVDMAAHLDSDPDPHFDSSYNWYYAGNGNMQLICVDWVDYLLHSQFHIMYVSQFTKNDTKVNSDHAVTYSCGEGNNIFETICSSQNIIAIRTKKKVIILKIVTSDDKIDVQEIKAMESELPFTGISFDGHHKNILYVTTLDNKLTIVNLDRMKGRSVKLKSKVQSLVDNWNTVVSSQRASYIYIARGSITMYDKRTNVPSYSYNNVRDITDDISCNDITAARPCPENPSLYFGTDHHLFLMDLRFHNKTKPKVVQRWTHGMQCVPTYMTMCHFEFNKEIICLSSQWCEDTCVVTNHTDELTKETHMYATIPYRPPSILNTLHEARQNLLCLDLYNPIDKRLCTAITGSMIFERGENYIILMQNSLGDISCHTIYPEHMESFIDDDSTKHLHEWSKPYKTKKKDFEVSSIEDFSGVWKKLKKVPESHRFGEGKMMTSERENFNEEEIFKAFDNEELDSGLLDLWTKTHNETTVIDSSLALNLHYSNDSE